MKKFITLNLIVVLISVVLLGCQPEGSNKLDLDGAIKEVRILKSNSDFSISFTDKENLQILRNILTSATKEEGIVDIRNPDFELEIIYEGDNKEVFYLWLEEDGGKGGLMKSEDTRIFYTLSEEMNEKLISLIQFDKS